MRVINTPIFIFFCALCFCNLSFGQGLVMWGSKNGVQVSGNTLTTQEGLFSPWATGAHSQNRLNPEQDGWITYTIPSNSNGCSSGFGFSLSDAAVGYLESINFAFVLEGHALLIYESGAFMGYFGEARPGDSMSIDPKGSMIRYLRNGELLHQKEADPSIAYWAAASFGSHPCQCSGLRSSFEAPITATATIDHVSCRTQGTGAIQLHISGGMGPYQVSWSNGSVGKNIQSLTEGNYTATITDAQQQAYSTSFTVANTSQWLPSQYAIPSADGLSASNEQPAAASTENRLIPNAEGWLSLEVPQGFEAGTMNGVVWGLQKSANPLTVSFEDIDYGFSIFEQNHLAVYEGGALVGIFGEIAAHDALKIAREQEGELWFIRYYKNDALLYESPVSGGKDLAMKAFLPPSRSIPQIASSFGCGSFFFENTQAGYDLIFEGAGLNDTLIGKGSLLCKPLTPVVGDTAQIKVKISPSGQANWRPFYLYIDHASRILGMYKHDDINSEPGPSSTFTRFDEAFEHKEYPQHVAIEKVSKLYDWIWENCGLFYVHPSTVDPDRNWVYKKTFGDDGFKREEIAYFDSFGRLIQGQVKNQSEQRILGSETAYDQWGRATVASLPAPTGNGCNFGFQSNFMQATYTDQQTGTVQVQSFDFYHFDNINGDNIPNKAGMPAEVSKIAPQSKLGTYYSDQNQDEAFVAASAYPYAQQELTPSGVMKSYRPGEVLHKGQNKEASGASFVVLNELDHYAQATDGTQNMLATSRGEAIRSSMALNAYKQVSIDNNGAESVSFYNRQGLLIASALSGDVDGVDKAVQTNSIMLSSHITVNGSQVKQGSYQLEGTGHIEIFNSSNNTILFDGTIDQLAPSQFPLNSTDLYLFRSINPMLIRYTEVGGTGSEAVISSRQHNQLTGFVDIHLARNQHQSVSITDLSSGTPATVLIYDLSGTEKQGNVLQSKLVASGNAASILVPKQGFYRIASDKPIQISFNSNYHSFSYNYYNLLGQLTYEVQPKGVDLSDPVLSLITTYAYDGNGSLLRSSTPDEGEFAMVYREDGTLRFSQNARQQSSDAYHYVTYEHGTGRVLERGEYRPNSSGATGPQHSFVMRDQAGVGSWTPMNATVHQIVEQESGLDQGRCHEATHMRYDEADPALAGLLSNAGIPAAGFQQTFMTGRLSTSWNDEAATWYSYDAQGRIRWTIKEIQGLGVFTMEYSYNFQGNLKEAVFNRHRADEQVWYRYSYDRDNRLVRVEFRADELDPWKEQAQYAYYLHGPLKRIELAEDAQGLDFVYTIEGMLKAINQPDLDPGKDPGKDGFATGSNQDFVADIFGFAIDYFDGDYQRSGTDIAQRTGMDPIYNGLIQSVRWKQRELGAQAGNPQAMNQSMYSYRYDERYQLVGADFGEFQSNSGIFTMAPNTYRLSNVQYDENGNIQQLDRSGNMAAMDALRYEYDLNLPNRLLRVVDLASSTANGSDMPQGTTQFFYDQSGRLTRKQDPNADADFVYDAYDMVTEVKDHSNNTTKLSYGYDEGGNRIRKTLHSAQGSTTTWYVQAGGALIATYEAQDSDPATQQEVALHGKGRIGVYFRATETIHYEITDHLGNVRSVFEKEVTASGQVQVQVREATDYYPFGSPLPGRSLTTSQDYRFGYQGKEQDPESAWTHFTLRNFDTRLGRWFNPDPYAQYHSAYLAMGNNPVSMVDPTRGYATYPWKWNIQWITATRVRRSEEEISAQGAMRYLFDLAGAKSDETAGLFTFSFGEPNIGGYSPGGGAGGFGGGVGGPGKAGRSNKKPTSQFGQTNRDSDTDNESRDLGVARSYVPIKVNVNETFSFKGKMIFYYKITDNGKVTSSGDMAPDLVLKKAYLVLDKDELFNGDNNIVEEETFDIVDATEESADIHLEIKIKKPDLKARTRRFGSSLTLRTQFDQRAVSNPEAVTIPGGRMIVGKLFINFLNFNNGDFKITPVGNESNVRPGWYSYPLFYIN